MIHCYKAGWVRKQKNSRNINSYDTHNNRIKYTPNVSHCTVISHLYLTIINYYTSTYNNDKHMYCA